MKSVKKIFRIFLLLTICVLLAASPAEAKKKSRRGSKARTEQTSSRKSSSKKKKSTRSSTSKSSGKKKKRRYTSARRRTYGSGSRRVSRTTVRSVTVEPAENRDAEPRPRVTTPARVDNRKKIKVEKPDLDVIRQMTLDPSSKFYFPKLKAKYEKNDTTMTPEEFRNFYLGYMFQEDFDPYRVSPYSNVTDELRQKPTHTKEEIDTITKYAQLALEDNPFDLRQMSFLVHVLKEKRKDMRAKIWEYRLENLLGAIKSTGTGDSVENAWYVMYPVHEYDMVQLLGYEAVDAQFIEPGYDYLAVQPDESDTRRRDKSAKGFYFNVMVPQQQYELKHPEDTGTVIDEPDIEKQEIDPDDLPAE